MAYSRNHIECHVEIKAIKIHGAEHRFQFRVGLSFEFPFSRRIDFPLAECFETTAIGKAISVSSLHSFGIIIFLYLLAPLCPLFMSGLCRIGGPGPA